jgi:hypothetical protein
MRKPVRLMLAVKFFVKCSKRLVCPDSALNLLHYLTVSLPK